MWRRSPTIHTVDAALGITELKHVITSSRRTRPSQRGVVAKDAPDWSTLVVPAGEHEGIPLINMIGKALTAWGEGQPARTNKKEERKTRRRAATAADAATATAAAEP